ncbi:MAG: ferritin-like domain-containing protein [Firmicutes bacterium]|nr:ferritin-like domain-containing protein [Bacillota bacterium]
MNWFYSLELNQVDLYTAQSQRVDDTYLSRALKRVAMIEQQYVDNIAGKIRDLGREPTKLGDMLAPVMGQLAGKASALAGPAGLLWLDIQLEEKAMKDYKEFLLQAGGEEELFNILWDNLIDEDLHTAWFANKLKELKDSDSKH